jgi:hypothetical protein
MSFLLEALQAPVSLEIFGFTFRSPTHAPLATLAMTHTKTRYPVKTAFFKGKRPLEHGLIFPVSGWNSRLPIP